MTTRNDITGDFIRSGTSKKYAKNYDNIDFTKSEEKKLVTHKCIDGLKRATLHGHECFKCGDTIFETE